jgi:hypothetical protein
MSSGRPAGIGSGSGLISCGAPADAGASNPSTPLVERATVGFAARAGGVAAVDGARDGVAGAGGDDAGIAGGISVIAPTPSSTAPAKPGSAVAASPVSCSSPAGTSPTVSANGRRSSRPRPVSIVPPATRPGVDTAVEDARPTTRGRAVAAAPRAAGANRVVRANSFGTRAAATRSPSRGTRRRSRAAATAAPRRPTLGARPAAPMASDRAAGRAAGSGTRGFSAPASFAELKPARQRSATTARSGDPSC